MKTTAALHHNDDNVNTQLIDSLFVFLPTQLLNVIDRTVQYSSHFCFCFWYIVSFNLFYAYRYCYFYYVYGINMGNDAFRLELC